MIYYYDILFFKEIKKNFSTRKAGQERNAPACLSLKYIEKLMCMNFELFSLKVMNFSKDLFLVGNTCNTITNQGS